jgi:Serine dehydratase alpha chain
VAGAEVGCQGEIGVASAMAAAMITHATGHPLEVTEIAATMALEHHLGMSCDPVGGFVRIPCIERNAFGAIKAYNAYLIATNEIASQHWEDLDRVIAAMLETERALPQPFKEMGTAGLPVRQYRGFPGWPSCRAGLHGPDGLIVLLFEAYRVQIWHPKRTLADPPRLHIEPAPGRAAHCLR